MLRVQKCFWSWSATGYICSYTNSLGEDDGRHFLTKERRQGRRWHRVQGKGLPQSNVACKPDCSGHEIPLHLNEIIFISVVLQQARAHQIELGSVTLWRPRLDFWRIFYPHFFMFPEAAFMSKHMQACYCIAVWLFYCVFKGVKNTDNLFIRLIEQGNPTPAHFCTGAESALMICPSLWSS